MAALASLLPLRPQTSGLTWLLARYQNCLHAKA